MKIRALSILFFLAWIGLCHAELHIHEHERGMTIESLYGTDEITEPVLIALIKSPMMERLKKIRQYGIAHYIMNIGEYTRFEHSIGVMILSRRYGASIEEQVAALLHDVSHTVFSHVADYVFKKGDGNTSYQDDRHEWFLEKTGIEALLAEYGYQGVCSDKHKHHYRILEQDLPDLCTDRIEYNLHGAYLERLLTKEEISTIVRDLRHEDGRWYFMNESSALLFAHASLTLTEHTFGSWWNLFTYKEAAAALKKALESGIVSYDDIHFSHDDEIWHRLHGSDDDSIRCALDRVLFYNERSAQGTEASHDLYLVGKFRGVNPWVKAVHGFERLTDINESFKREYERVQQHIARGCYISYA